MGMFDNHRPGYFDHARFVIDLIDTSEEIQNTRRRHKMIKPPMVYLDRLGKDMLHATPGDHGAMRLRREAQATGRLSHRTFARVYGGVLSLSWSMAAIILARDDLAQSFGDELGRLSFEKGLQWLVLHGIREHRLWHLITPDFVAELTLSKVPGTQLSPLQVMVLRERPALSKLLNEGTSFNKSAKFDRWLGSQGSVQFGLFWCLPHQHSRRLRNRRLAASAAQFFIGRYPKEHTRYLHQYSLRARKFLSGQNVWPSKDLLAGRVLQLVEMMSKIDPDLGVFGYPLCFWSGKVGELSILDGQFDAPSEHGILVRSTFVTLTVPSSRPNSHTIVVEALSADGNDDCQLFSCRVDRKWAPIIRLARGPRHLWVIDIAPSARGHSTNWHVVSLEVGTMDRAERGQLVLSRIWVF